MWGLQTWCRRNLLLLACALVWSSAQAEETLGYIEFSLINFENFVREARPKLSSEKELQKIVDRYYAHLSDEDRDFYVLQLNLYGLAFMDRDGTKLNIYLDQRLKNKESWRVDYRDIQDGQVVVNDETYSLDLSRGFRDHYQSIEQMRARQTRASSSALLWAWNVLIPDAHSEACAKGDTGAVTNIGIGAAGLASTCVFPPTAIAGAAFAVGAGVVEGCRAKSLKAGFSRGLRELPVVGDIQKINEGLQNMRKSSTH